MRLPTFTVVLGGALSVLGACAQEAVSVRPPAAVSVERYARPAAATAPDDQHGYSADARRMADCLASYPNYDARTDRLEVRPGETRPCPL